MPKTLDILIGFSLVMLIVSMAVTMLTELIGSALFNLRGRALRVGIAQLLTLLDRGLNRDDAAALANHILRNPLIGQPPVAVPGYGLATVIHREELVGLILDFAADGDAEKANDHEVSGEQRLRNKLRKSLADNGIPHPETIIVQIRNKVLEIEKDHPEMSRSARLNLAILEFGQQTAFLSKLNSWFDQTIDRVSEAFTTRIRIVTTLVAIMVALFLHLDSLALMNRLSVDDALRDRLVASAVQRVEQQEQQEARERQTPPAGSTPSTQASAVTPRSAAPAHAPAALSTPPANAPATPAALSTPPANAPATPPTAAPRPAGSANCRAAAMADRQMSEDICRRVAAIREAGVDDLEQFGLIDFPRSLDEWVSRWSIRDGGGDQPGARQLAVLMQLFGILLTAALLSLGAPFWYSTLRDLVKLRPLIARREEVDRTERETTQAA